MNALRPVLALLALLVMSAPSRAADASNGPLVLTGTNLFAIEVHQAKTNGADMRFDFGFSGLKTEP